MKLFVERRTIRIVPETPQDEAMLEDTFGLRRDGDAVSLVRHNAMGLSCWGDAEVRAVREMPEEEVKP